MWRFRKNFIVMLSFMLTWLSVRAQQKTDSTQILKYASTMDDLYPTLFIAPASLFDFKFDSTYFVRTDSERKLQITDSSYRSHYIFKGKLVVPPEKVDTIIENYQLSWNNQGYIENLNCKEKYGTKGFSFSYKNGKFLETEIRSASEIVDSVQLFWNRSGKLGGERAVSYGYGLMMIDTVRTMGKLYDSKGRLIVISNYLFQHTTKGTMVYEYLDNGKLARRSFLLNTGGPLIFTDTLIYSFADSAKTLLRTQHKLKIAGNDQWIDIDEKTEMIENSLLSEYKLFLNVYSNQYKLIGKEYLQWQYNSAKQPVIEIRSNQSGSYTNRTNYYYNQKGLCDSVLTNRMSYRKGKMEQTGYTRTIITYVPGTKLIDTITTKAFGLMETGSQAPWRREKESVIHFKWN
jgi:hypothetical protein